MKFLIWRSSGMEPPYPTARRFMSSPDVENDDPGIPRYEIEVGTLEELMTIHKMVNYPLIIQSDSIEIYDTFRE